MVDILGGIHRRVGARGPPGLMGLPGKSGITDVCTWMPKTILQNFRKNEMQCCLLLTNLKKDIKRNHDGNIIEWISRSNIKFNATADISSSSKTIVKLSDKRYALDFHKSLYFVEDMTLIPIGDDSGYVNICIIYADSDHEQTIISSYDSGNPNHFYREILATSTELCINDVRDDKKVTFVPIQHNTRQWTTLYVEWIYDYNGNNKGAHMINNGEMIGEFTCSTPLFEMTGISIGGRGVKNNCSQVLLLAHLKVMLVKM